jgi:putative tryptophan/tyrosine transport system substrate-binding protein
VKRREFISLLAGAAAGPPLLWPRAALASEASGQRGDPKAQAAKPVIGFLGPTSSDVFSDRMRGFQRGLKEAGYVEGENLTIVYRWAEGEFDRLPAMAADLVGRQVNVIATGATSAALAAKAATTTIPVLFIVADDPVALGLVASVARPGGNVTGVNLLSAEVASKRLEFLRELIPGAARVALLINPADANTSESILREVETAARAIGLSIEVYRARTSGEIDAAFAAFARERPDAVFLGTDPFFTGRRVQLANLASRHAIPMASATREITDVGGLMSYGANIPDAWRQVGAYAGRILKGEKPAALPVVQATKLELVVNAQTARILGLAVPPTLLAAADEVIE